MSAKRRKPLSQSQRLTQTQSTSQSSGHGARHSPSRGPGHLASQPVRPIRAAATLLLAFLLLWAPYLSGLYSSTYQLWAFLNAAVALGLVLWLGLVEGRPLRLSAVRVTAGLLFLAYVASLAVAVTPGEAARVAAKEGLFLVVLLAVSELIRSARRAEGQLSGLLYTVWSAITLFGLASLVASVAFPGSGVVMAERLYTFMRYPNSAGALAGTGLLLGLGLRHNRPSSPLVDSLLAAGQWVNAALLVTTMSRGAWLVLPAAALVTVLLWPKGRRWALLGDLVFTGVAGVAVAAFIPRFFGQPFPGLLVVLAGLALGVGAGWVSRWYQKLAPRVQGTLAVSAFLAVAVLGFGIYRAGVLPPTLMARLAGFSLSDRSAAERIAWTKDALKIVKDHPVLGVGGGGWATVYFQYQSYGYPTKEVHNDFVQTWVETGTIGFGCWLALLAAAAWAVLKGRKSLAQGAPGSADGRAPTSADGRVALLASLAGAAAMTAAHTAIDFDLALGAMGVYLWALFGVIDGLTAPMDREPATEAAPNPPAPAVAWPRLGALAALALVTLLATSLLAGQIIADRASSPAAKITVQQRYRAFTTAARLDPLSRGIEMNLCQAAEKLYQGTGNKTYLTEAHWHAERVVALDPESPNSHAFLSAFVLRYGDFAGAKAESSEALRLQPFEAQRYADSAHIHLLAAIDTIKKTGPADAQADLEEALAMVDAVAAQSAKVPAWVPAGSGMPTLPPPVALYAGEAALLLDRTDRAGELLGFAFESPRLAGAHESDTSAAQRQAEAALWLSALETNRGNAEAAAQYLARIPATAQDPEKALQSVLDLLTKAGF